MATVVPATVMLPDRDEVEVFAATLKLTVPLPVPLLPAVMDTQLRPSVAVQLQFVPEFTVTVTVPVAPPAAKLGAVGLTVKPQAPA
jgi:hypothetical protein